MCERMTGLDDLLLAHTNHKEHIEEKLLLFLFLFGSRISYIG